jgi:hypothetical protein
MKFLQLDERLEDPSSFRTLKNEIEWINKFREMGIKTPKYFKTISMFGKDNQEHHGILVERVVSSSNPNFRCSKTLPIFLELCVVQRLHFEH